MKLSKIMKSFILPITLLSVVSVGLLTNLVSKNEEKLVAEGTDLPFSIELSNLSLVDGSLYNLYDDDENSVALFEPANNGDTQSITYKFNGTTEIKHIYFYGGNASGGQLFDGHIDYLNLATNEWVKLHDTNAENLVFELTPNVSTTEVRLVNTYITVAGVREFSINNYEHVVYYEGLVGNHEAVTNPHNKIMKNMVDSSYDSFTWFGNVTGATASLILDLGSEQRINYVQLLMGSDFLSSVSFSYSLTKDGEYSAIDATHYAVSDRLVYLKEPIVARFIKATAESTWVKVRDFSAGYGLELSSNYSVYSYQRSSLPYSSLGYGTDLNTNTFLDLENNTSEESCVIKNLLEESMVTSIFLSTGGHSYYDDSADNLSLSYSLDNKNWTIVDSSTILNRSGTGFYDYLVVFDKPINAQYIKVSDSNGGWLTIADFSINSLFNLHQYLDDSFLNCDVFKKDMSGVNKKIDSLYSSLNKYEQTSLSKDELHKINYYQTYASIYDTNSLSNNIFKLNDKNNLILIILLTSGVTLLIGTLAYFLMRKKSKYFIK